MKKQTVIQIKETLSSLPVDIKPHLISLLGKESVEMISIHALHELK
ncbi:MAG: hypothetical protein ACTS73_03405 [Arsenophonus sp. NEOnobi-MAG3]